MLGQELSPIILFTYNRPLHTFRTLEALAANTLAEKSDLYIFSDAAKSEKDEDKVNEVRKVIHNAKGFNDVKIKEQNKNRGLANSVISGVSEILKSHKTAIVLEDDLITSPNFLVFMNSLLREFENSSNIMSIGGYRFPIKVPENYSQNIILSRRFPSWGWATWSDKWSLADWEVTDFDELSQNRRKIQEFNRGGEDLFEMLKDQKEGMIDSWAIRWAYAHYKNNMYSVIPSQSKVLNIGADGSGTHVASTSRYKVDLDMNKDWVPQYNNLKPDPEIENALYAFMKKSRLKKLTGYIRRIILRRISK